LQEALLAIAIKIWIQMVAQVFNLCLRRLKPVATHNYLLIAPVVLKSHLLFSGRKTEKMSIMKYV
jgi:hypothetical protein